MLNCDSRNASPKKLNFCLWSSVAPPTPQLIEEVHRKGSKGDLDLGASHSSPLWKGGSAVPRNLNAFIEIKTPSCPKVDG